MPTIPTQAGKLTILIQAGMPIILIQVGMPTTLITQIAEMKVATIP
jgi:hypothetical protein